MTLTTTSETTRMMLFDRDYAICVGGKWDGWIFHRRPDGEWVSIRQAVQEVMETIPPAPDARDEVATQPKFRRGDRVRKVSGSEWVGTIVGEYSTALTPEGYAVESESHAGSVQIYPARALAAIDALEG